jgi:hypothetical protein
MAEAPHFVRSGVLAGFAAGARQIVSKLDSYALWAEAGSYSFALSQLQGGDGVTHPLAS